MKIINWTNVINFSIFLTLLSLSMKLSASYEGCLLIQRGDNFTRILLSLIVLIVSFMFLFLLRKDFNKMFIKSLEDEKQCK